MAPNSLNFRLWMTIAIAVAPLFLFALNDYREHRGQAMDDMRTTITHRLADASREAQWAYRTVAQVLKIMASSDDLQSLDPEDCNGIASRLLGSVEGFANIGAALPDGKVFCSARNGATPVSVSDRRWFRHAVASKSISPGEFIVGRITGKSGLVFGYPLRAPTGELRAVLFASITLSWFERLVEGFSLPAGWEASVISASGQILAHRPNPAHWREATVPHSLLTRLSEAISQEGGVAQFAGMDGARRLYGVSAPEFAGGSGFMTIGAPLDQSLDALDRRLQLQLALIACLALASALLARFYVYRLIEIWAARIRSAVDRIADGSLDTRVAHSAGIVELDALSQGINRMASEIEKHEAELRRLSMVVERSPESIVITDTQARIVYVNESFQRTTGYSLADVVGKTPSLLDKGLTPRATYDEMWACLARGEVWRGEFHNTRKDGTTYLELASISPIKDPSGKVTHYVALKEDITQRKQSEALLHRLAYYDALTELPNRALLHDRIAQAIRSLSRSDAYGMLMLLDIDRFQQLNDTLGHAAGDRLLRSVSARLRASVRDEDTVARHGDDDFAILIEQIGDNETDALLHAEHLARKVQRELEAPYGLGEGENDRHYATLSMGISLFHGKVISLDTLLKQAEVALYRAKQDGRNNICFFNPDMQAVVDAHSRMEARLHEALESRAFRLFYQPQFDRRGRLTGAEALVRWPLDDGTMVSPADFIPLAEDTGHIVPLGLWVLHTACLQLAQWQTEAHTRALTIAVNVSARQFHQPDFVASVTRTVTEAGIDPGRLKLELTESAILSDLDETIARMNQLREFGIQFALDDFGTGYSSLSYLKRLPFDQLKIDQSFVRDMARDASSEAIVLAVLSMSHALGMEVIAEGVETAAQREFLHRHGCEFYQGYLFGKPLPIDTWGEFLALA
ncbi:MAG: EAL domain-containing protein [Thauera sp.]|nr:EAL domain-containing protein [Thauera sp.]